MKLLNRFKGFLSFSRWRHGFDHVSDSTILYDKRSVLISFVQPRADFIPLSQSLSASSE